MSEEGLTVETATTTGLNLFMLVRLLIWSGVVAVALKFLVKFALETKRKVKLINKIPGPKSFNPLLGNIPLDIVKYVGADYEASKDMYLSEFHFLLIISCPITFRWKFLTKIFSTLNLMRTFSLTDLLQALKGYTQVYKKERIFRIWLGWEPLLILWKPESVETVLSHNFLLDKSSEYNMLHSWVSACNGECI